RTRAGRLLHELLQTATGGALIAAAGQTAEHVARLVGRQPFRPRALDEVADRAILRAADPDAVLPARLPDCVAAAFRRVFRAADPLVRFRVGDDQRVVLEDPDAARPAEVPPLVDDLHVLVEDLDAVVRAIGDEQASFGVEREAVRSHELAGLAAVA